MFFVLFFPVLFVCLLYFLRVLIQKLHSSENVFWRRKSSFRRHFSLLYRKSYLKRGQGKHRQCRSEYRYIWCRSFSGDGWNSCYLLGRYKGQIGESKFSVWVMTLSSRSAKTKALHLSTGRRSSIFFFRVFQPSTKRTWSIMYPLPRASRPLRDRLSPEKRKKAPALQATFDCISHPYLLRVLRIAFLLRITHL